MKLKQTTRFVKMIALVAILAGPALFVADAAPAPQGANVLRLGYLGPADSDAASGALLAIDQVNGSGGFTAADGVRYQFELLMLAAAPTAGNLSANVEALLGQNVVALLGPDTDETLTAENIVALAAAGVPVLTTASSDLLTEQDTSDGVFRLSATNQDLSGALATYMVEDLGLTSIALIQTDVDSTEALLDFEAALAGMNIGTAARIQLADNTTLASEGAGLLDVNPEAVVMWGPVEDAAALLTQLREAGWTGRFAYRRADEARRAGVLSREVINGVLGVTTWSYAYTARASRVFLQDYVVAFGQVPGPLAAAQYDGVWALRAAMVNQGIAPAALKAGLLNAPNQVLVQGILRPTEFGNGDISRNVMVYELEPGGGATVLAVFDGPRRMFLEDAGN